MPYGTIVMLVNWLYSKSILFMCQKPVKGKQWFCATTGAAD